MNASLTVLKSVILLKLLIRRRNVQPTQKNYRKRRMSILSHESMHFLNVLQGVRR